MPDSQDNSSQTAAPARNALWYAVYTKPRQEHVAELHLTRQGFDAYLPRVAQQKRKQGQLTSFITAFFPRYLFVRFDAHQDNWAPIRSTRGVSSLVKIQGVPKPVPASFIESLKDNEDSAHLQRQEPASWQPGDVVEIEQGPFAGYRCVFQARRSADRVAVLLNLIGKSTLATINAEDLQLPGMATA